MISRLFKFFTRTVQKKEVYVSIDTMIQYIQWNADGLKKGSESRSTLLVLIDHLNRVKESK